MTMAFFSCEGDGDVVGYGGATWGVGAWMVAEF